MSYRRSLARMDQFSWSWVGPRTRTSSSLDLLAQLLPTGIMESGAWYLLVPEHYIKRRPNTMAQPFASTRFTSLSPIEFQDLGKLKVKLSFLNLNSRKMKQSRKNYGTARDTSEANNKYTVDFGNATSARTTPYSFNTDSG